MVAMCYIITTGKTKDLENHITKKSKGGYFLWYFQNFIFHPWTVENLSIINVM